MLRTTLLALAAAGILGACNRDEGPDIVQPRLQVRLTDAPGDYEKVLIDVVDVQLRFGEGDAASAPELYAGTYDLLELTNGVDTLIAAGDMPVGELKEVRLILGDDNFVQIDGAQHALSTPSAQQSGLKIKLDGAELEPGRAYELLLDFDAGRSIVEAGNSGKYNLKPVIRATLREVDDPVSARIEGILAPAERQYVFAYAEAGDTVGTYADSLGAFALVDLAAGLYTLEVSPGDSVGSAFRQEGILVVQGQTVDLGTIAVD